MQKAVALALNGRSRLHCLIRRDGSGSRSSKFRQRQWGGSTPAPAGRYGHVPRLTPHACMRAQQPPTGYRSVIAAPRSTQANECSSLADARVCRPADHKVRDDGAGGPGEQVRAAALAAGGFTG